MGRFFWLVIAAVAIVALLLMSNNDSGTTMGLDNDVFARAAYLGIWGVVLAAGLLGSGIKLSDFARNMAVWAVIILGLVAGYQYRYDLQDAASRITAGLIPGSPISGRNAEGSLTVTLAKAANGHFEVNGRVNGARVHFLVDTGASSVVLSQQDAERAGLDTGSLNYNVPVMTANGTASAASITIANLQIGNIERQNIRAMVTKEGLMTGSLLGMNFLQTLGGFTVRGDQLILID
ncbi:MULTISPECIES: TIGR02281 family clan AA aspartic protease [Ochrobactrum]|uniref:CblY, a non-orthologous displasment for Alpha-ribazole-5'-phosphate phosphatase n=1 Tax=Ochrobactrum soli TaxID=2448455 RepID=A0A2P9HMU7_9HYPH|nr:TIGR02281 family clan AA aspartic protease [[Ochrobactrum] soli]MCI0999706.1 TIGR02281 family clan AA aspartic protease [Ochrobactrum sp. C6C9]SPL65150.1 CblY, a non-orthologous displasment for Alpha-ribazole-5'-phosphate phosphatase [[Ochrobactrum] soli]